jgi:hypothetical protein
MIRVVPCAYNVSLMDSYSYDLHADETHLEVIKAWDESVIDMSIGEVAKIHCSPDYAYGAGGFPAWGIMPNVSVAHDFRELCLPLR